MSNKRYYSAKEASEILGISQQTLYAYVSRGLIRSERSAQEKRQRRYYAEDIEKLLARKAGRRNPEMLAQDALHWGSPVLDSAITLIDDGNLYYRGYSVAQLA
ncbi:MAG: citrate synthase, partial [Anaerolineae bacterium]|nr:citrate synthase [Anaerolineae bacterium]